MAVVRSRGIRHAGMDRMVQQKTPVGTNWKYPASRSRGALLRHAGRTANGCVT